MYIHLRIWVKGYIYGRWNSGNRGSGVWMITAVYFSSVNFLTSVCTHIITKWKYFHYKTSSWEGRKEGFSGKKNIHWTLLNDRTIPKLELLFAYCWWVANIFFFCKNMFTLISEYDAWVTNVCIPQVYTNKCLFLMNVLPSRAQYSPQLQIADQTHRAHGIGRMYANCSSYFLYGKLIALPSGFFTLMWRFQKQIIAFEFKKTILWQNNYLQKIIVLLFYQCGVSGLIEMLIMYAC